MARFWLLLAICVGIFMDSILGGRVEEFCSDGELTSPLYKLYNDVLWSDWLLSPAYDSSDMIRPDC